MSASTKKCAVTQCGLKLSPAEQEVWDSCGRNVGGAMMAMVNGGERKRRLAYSVLTKLGNRGYWIYLAASSVLQRKPPREHHASE